MSSQAILDNEKTQGTRLTPISFQAAKCKKTTILSPNLASSKTPKEKGFRGQWQSFEYEIASQTSMMSQAAVTVLEERFKPGEGVVGIARAF